MAILELTHAFEWDFLVPLHLLDFEANVKLVIHDNFANRSSVLYAAMNHSSFCPISCRWYGIGLPWLSRVTEN